MAKQRGLTEKAVVSSELVPAFRKRGCYAYKIPDPPSQFGGAHTRFTKKRPYDFFWALEGKFYAAEAKLSKKLEAFGWGTLKPHQQEGLEEVMEHGKAEAYVFLIVRQAANKEEGIERLNRLYIFEYQYLKEQFELLGRNFRKVEIEEMPYYVGSCKDYHIDGFINELKEMK